MSPSSEAEQEAQVPACLLLAQGTSATAQLTGRPLPPRTLQPAGTSSKVGPRGRRHACPCARTQLCTRQPHAVPPPCARAHAGNHACPHSPVGTRVRREYRRAPKGPRADQALEANPVGARAVSREGPGGGARGAGLAGSGRVCAAAVCAAPPSAPPLALFLTLQPPP